MHFPRPQLANRIADDLEGKNPFSDAPNGLFLAAPRRTGKSSFLENDLAPLLRMRGKLVIYVDLWEDKSRSPMALISEKIGTALMDNLGLVAKTASKAGLKEITLPGGFKMDLSKIGKPDGLSLYASLALLHKNIQQPIVLIIDEAQHALTSPEGEAAMSALKSARDQMNTPQNKGLMLVFSGSHRDKLLRLVNNASAPFWGSQVQKLDTLGAPYATMLANTLRSLYPSLLSISDTNMALAFQHFGERPQFMKRGIERSLQITPDARTFDSTLLEIAKNAREEDFTEMTQAYLSLEPLPQTIMRRLLEEGDNFRPYHAASLSFYQKCTNEPCSATQAQRAIETLRDRQPPLVWKSLRGDYSLYDQSMADWYARLVNQRQWPPLPSGHASAAYPD